MNIDKANEYIQIMLNLCIFKPNRKKMHIYWKDDLVISKPIPSYREMSSLERDLIWYSKDQFFKFAYDEIERRKKLGIASTKILCPIAETNDAIEQ